jgi:hypothetical protein
MHFPTLVSLRDQSKVSGPAHHLLLMLALHGYRETNVSSPSVGRLAHALGVTSRHVRSLLKELVAIGAVRITHGGGRHTNTYEVIPPTAPDELSTPRHSTSGVKSSPRNASASQPGTGEPGTPEPECTQKRVLKEISKDEGGLAHEVGETQHQGTVGTLNTDVPADEHLAPTTVATDSHTPKAPDHGPDWEAAWRQRYDREVTQTLTFPSRARAPAFAPGPSQMASAVHAMVAGVAAKATLPAEDVEARRARLRAQSAQLIAQGY